MVVSPLTLAVNIATLGTASGATTAAASASRFATLTQKMKQLAAATKDLRQIAKEAKQVGTLAYEVNNTTYLWVNDYVGNFESMTSKRVVNELKRHFSGSNLLWVEQQYAKIHLALMLKANGIDSAENVLGVVSTFDPSGVAGVIDAFAKPICSVNRPFPNVALIKQTAPAPIAPAITPPVSPPPPAIVPAVPPPPGSTI